jgi:hypothetical protein
VALDAAVERSVCSRRFAPSRRKDIGWLERDVTTGATPSGRSSNSVTWISNSTPRRDCSTCRRGIATVRGSSSPAATTASLRLAVFRGAPPPTFRGRIADIRSPNRERRQGSRIGLMRPGVSSLQRTAARTLSSPNQLARSIASGLDRSPPLAAQVSYSRRRASRTTSSGNERARQAALHHSGSAPRMCRAATGRARRGPPVVSLPAARG